MSRASTTWQCIFSMPHSKTANRPTGPAPIMQISVLCLAACVIQLPDEVSAASFPRLHHRKARAGLQFEDRHRVADIAVPGVGHRLIVPGHVLLAVDGVEILPAPLTFDHRVTHRTQIPSLGGLLA